MGLLRLKYVSVVLVWVVILLNCNHSADSTQLQHPSDPFVDLQHSRYGPDSTIWGNNSEIYMDGRTYPGINSRVSRCVYSEPIRFKDNATGPEFSFSVQFVASVLLSSPPPWLLGFNGTGPFSTNILEGFTFAILPDDHGAGGDGGYLGLLNATSHGNNQSHTLAVEFDFVETPQFDA